MCKFSINYQGSIDPLIEKARTQITSNGGTFNDNTEKGSFSVKGIEGSYTVQPDAIAFHITKKPFIVGCGFIENKLREYLG